MRHPHFFICPRCGEPTDKLVNLRCLACAKADGEGEGGGKVGLNHRATADAVASSGHPGTF